MKTVHQNSTHLNHPCLDLISFIILAVSLTGCSTNKPKPYNSREELGPQLNYTITGIDAGDGSMMYTQRAIKAYGLDKVNWQLQASSSACMLATLQKAIRYHQPIVITAWTPHWMFQKYPIKFLKDPKHVYSQSEHIDTLARSGFKQSDPGAYKLLKNFHWNSSEMDGVMYKLDHGSKPAPAAQAFLKSHPKKVKRWLAGVPQGHGQNVKLDLVAWDSELASTNVLAGLLKDKGYHPQIIAMEEQPMWAALATGAADASTAGWLPDTMGHLYHQYKGKVVVVRTNLTHADVGLAVPKYMKKINSIQDLKNK